MSVWSDDFLDFMTYVGLLFESLSRTRLQHHKWEVRRPRLLRVNVTFCSASTFLGWCPTNVYAPKFVIDL